MTSMGYRLLGRSGLRVSDVGLGTMTFGATTGWGVTAETAKELYDTYREAGGNYVDTANQYALGESERVISGLVSGHRDEVVIASKYTNSAPRNGDANAGGNQRKNMVQSIEGTLRRLGTDYVDLYVVHSWDMLTPVDEVMRGLDDLVRAGKVLYVGVSNTPAWVVAKSNTMAELRGWTAYAGLQIEYSLLGRSAEAEYFPMAADQGLSVLAWSPLKNGLLTGKYAEGGGEGSRLTTDMWNSKALAWADPQGTGEGSTAQAGGRGAGHHGRRAGGDAGPARAGVAAAPAGPCRADPGCHQRRPARREPGQRRDRADRRAGRPARRGERRTAALPAPLPREPDGAVLPLRRPARPDLALERALMASRRDLIRMSDEEVWAFLTEQRFGVLGTTGPDGAPHMVNVGFLVEDRRIVLTSFAAAQKVRNLERQPTASFLVEVPWPYHQIRGVLRHRTGDPRPRHRPGRRGHHADAQRALRAGRRARRRPGDRHPEARREAGRGHDRAGPGPVLGPRQARRLLLMDRTAWYTDGPEEVADGVVRLPMPVGVDGLHAVNVYVLRGEDDRVDLIDAGDAAEVTPARLDEALRGVGASITAVRRVLVTHVHPDHYTLAPPVRQRSGATVHLGEGERDNLGALNRLLRGERTANIVDDLERVGGTELTPELDPARLAGRRGPEIEGPDVWVTDGTELSVGTGRCLTAVSTPGHTRGHVVFHDAGSALWFSGDHVLPHITPSIGFESAPVLTALGDYLSSLRLLLDRPDGLLLPAHGPVRDSTHGRARELLEHHEERLADTLDAVHDGGSTSYEVAARLRWTRHERRFPDLEAWHRFLASTETAAHLEVLVDRGLVERTDPRGKAEVFRPTGGADVARA